MISIEAKKAISIFDAATECMRHYSKVSMRIAQRDVKKFSMLFRENAELMSRLEDFVETMRGRLNEFNIDHKVDEKLKRTEFDIESLKFPDPSESNLAITLQQPEDDPADQNDGDDMAAISFARKADNTIDPWQIPTSNSENIEVKEHVKGGEEMSYNPVTNCVTFTFIDSKKNNARGVKTRNLKDGKEDTFHIHHDFDPKYAFAPSENARIFSSKSNVYLVKDKTKLADVFKKDAKDSLNWDLTAPFNRLNKFTDRPFVAGPNFYCRPVVSGGNLELQVSNFDSISKTLIKINEISLKDDKDKDALATFGIFAQGETSSLVVVLSTAGYLVVKKGENNATFLKLSLAKAENTFHDAFYVSSSNAVYVLRQEGNNFFVDKVVIDEKLTATKISIPVQAEGLPSDAKRARLGVIPLKEYNLSIFIIFNEEGLMFSGVANEQKPEKSEWKEGEHFVDSNDAFVSEMKLSKDGDGLVTSICSRNNQSEQCFSTIAIIRAQ